jgi:hypothetical protein
MNKKESILEKLYNTGVPAGNWLPKITTLIESEVAKEKQASVEEVSARYEKIIDKMKSEVALAEKKARKEGYDMAMRDCAVSAEEAKQHKCPRCGKLVDSAHTCIPSQWLVDELEAARRDARVEVAKEICSFFQVQDKCCTIEYCEDCIIYKIEGVFYKHSELVRERE